MYTDSVIGNIFLALEQVKLQNDQFGQYTLPLNLLASLILQDEGYLAEQLNGVIGVDANQALGAFQISLLQLGLIEHLVPLLNLGVRDNDRTLIFLILEKYLLGLSHHSGKLMYSAD